MESLPSKYLVLSLYTALLNTELFQVKISPSWINLFYDLHLFNTITEDGISATVK